MSWIYLFLAGMLEAVWTIGLKFTNGFTRPIASLVVIVAIAGSMFLLSLALKTIPVSTGYAIWVSIGIIGAVIAGPLLFNETVRPIQVVFLVAIVISVIGLKITSTAN